MRENWSNNLGFVLSAVGSAVGLANILRFPYLVATNHGGVFLISYILSLMILAIPVLITELSVGKISKKCPVGAAVQLTNNKKWALIGYFNISVGLFVSGFYAALASKILYYAYLALTGKLAGVNTLEAADKVYSDFNSNAYMSIGWYLIFLVITAFCIRGGIKKSIERINNICMPLIVIILFWIIIVTLSGNNLSKVGNNLFNFNLSKFSTSIWVAAMGQAFFTLSAGQGTMVTYGSYLKPKTNLIRMILPIVLADTFIAILAAIAIFSMAFSANAGIDSGFSLLFRSIVVICNNLNYGYFIITSFFILVLSASISSEISALEPAVTYLVDNFSLSRKKASYTAVFIALISGFFAAYKDKYLMQMDYLATTFLIPIGAFMIIILANKSWKYLEHEFKSYLNLKVIKCFNFLITFITPAAIILLVISLIVG